MTLRRRLLMAALGAVAGIVFCLPTPRAAERQAPTPRPAPPGDRTGFPALEAVEREVATMVEMARPSVVGIIARSRLEPLLGLLGGEVRIEEDVPGAGPIARRVGSGIVLDERGHIATLSAVVAGASEILVIPAEGEKLRARVRGLDDYTGLAVLAIDPPPIGTAMRPAVFGDSDDLKPGSLVTAFSSPAGRPAAAPAYAFGFVTGVGLSQGPGRRCPYIKFNAYASPGAGGGPVLDTRGRLVGMLFGAGDPERGAADRIIRWDVAPPRDEDDAKDEKDAPAAEDLPGSEHDRSVWILRSLKRGGDSAAADAYAVPGNLVRRVSEEIIRSGTVSRGWVGVKIEETEPGDVRLLGVVPGSPADKAGLRAGDRIVAFNGAPLTGSGPLVDGISSSPPGAEVRLGILRGGRQLEVAFALGAAPETPHRLPRMAMLPSPPHPAGPVLGVEVDVLTDDDLRSRLGAPEGVGLLVERVYEGSRAQEAGLRSGDLLLEALGEPLRTLSDLRRALRRQGPRSMQVRLVRDGRRLDLRVPPALQDAPPSEAPPAPPAPPRRPPS